LKLCHLDELDFSPMRTTYFLSRETVIASRLEGMSRWRQPVRVPVEERQRQPALLQPAVEPGDRAGNPGRDVNKRPHSGLFHIILSATLDLPWRVSISPIRRLASAG
jgi:hypothetical protein